MSAYDVADLYATFNREASGVTMGPAAPCCASCASCARGQPCEAVQAAGVEGAPCVGCGRPTTFVQAGVGGDTSVPDPVHPQCIITFHCDNKGQHCTSTSSCGGRGVRSYAVGGLPDARLGYGTNDMAAAYGVGGAGGDLMDIAFNGYRCAADGPGPAGTGSTDGGEHPTNCGCGACPIVQEMLDQKKAEDEANGVGAVYAAHRAPAPPPPAPIPQWECDFTKDPPECHAVGVGTIYLARSPSGLGETVPVKAPDGSTWWCNYSVHPPECEPRQKRSFAVAGLPDARLGYGENGLAAAYRGSTTTKLAPAPTAQAVPTLPINDMLPPCGAGTWVQVSPMSGVIEAFGMMPPAVEQIESGYQPFTVWTMTMAGLVWAKLIVGYNAPVYYACETTKLPTRSPPSSASRLAGLPDARLGYSGNDVADAYGVGAVPAGLGVTASQIDQDLVRANTLAAAHQYATDDFTDAVQACDTACTDVIAAEQALSSTPSMSIIGTQSGIINQLIGNAAGSRMTTGNYETAYTAATTAYQAYLKDAALPANVTPSPTPAPAPAPAPPIVVLPTNPQPAPAPVVPAPAPASTSYAKPILYTAAAAGVALVGYAAYKRYYAKGGRKTLPFSQRKTRVPSGRTMHSARTIKA